MHHAYKVLFVIFSAGLSFWIVSIALRAILLYVNPSQREKRNLTIHIQLRDVGTWIGLCEFVLILLFVLVKEYAAIAIIFAAKEIVRSEQIKEDASYYLLGTLLNVTLSLLFAFVLKGLAGYLFP